MSFTWKIDDGLSLRLLLPSDAEAVYAMLDRNREHLRPWFRWAPSVESVEATREKIAWYCAKLGEDGRVMTVIEAGGEGVGLIYVCDRSVDNRRAEIGYWLDERAQGKGYMTRAGRAMVAYCFGVLDCLRVDITADVENPRSRGVAERLGFTHEATMASWMVFPDGRVRDAVSYRLLREDWEAQP